MTILNSADITENGYFTPSELGSNRVVVFAGNGESGYTSRPLIGLSLGGVQFVEAIYEGSSLKPKTGVWYIKEANIPTGSSQLLADWGGELHDNVNGMIYTLQDIDQVSTVLSSDKDFIATSSSGIDLAIAVEPDAMVVAVAATNSQYTGVNFSNTQAASSVTLSHDLDYSSSAYQADVLSFFAASSGNETVGIRCSGNDAELVAVAAAFKPAAATTTETLDNVTLEPAAGKQFVTIGATPDLTYKSLLYGTDPAAVTGDQLESDTVTSDGKAITLNDDGTFSIENVGTNVQTFQYRIYDADGDGWSEYATATITPSDGAVLIINIDVDNTVYPMQTAVINMTRGGNTVIAGTLGGSSVALTGTATETTRPVVIPSDLPYGLHQLIMEIS